VSLSTLAIGARQLVVQLALEMTGIAASSKVPSLTPITNIGASAEGAEIMTLRAPPLRCALALSTVVNTPVLRADTQTHNHTHKKKKQKTKNKKNTRRLAIVSFASKQARHTFSSKYTKKERNKEKKKKKRRSTHLSTTYSAPCLPHGIADGSRSALIAIRAPLTTRKPSSSSIVPLNCATHPIFLI
jgi:hypothetical protein